MRPPALDLGRVKEINGTMVTRLKRLVAAGGRPLLAKNGLIQRLTLQALPTASMIKKIRCLISLPALKRGRQATPRS